VGVPFKHLVSVVQMANFDFGQVKEILHRGGYEVQDEEALRGRAQYARRWLEEFAPEEMKFTLKPALPAEAARLTEPQRRFLAAAADRLKPGMKAEEIHQAVYALAGEMPLKPAEAFQAIYLALLGTLRGPRVGWFLAFLDHDFVVNRFREASRP
jgi:lysyl-tRNA synthetase class 1